MIPVNSTVINEQSGVGKEVEFSIKKKNFAVIFHFLRAQCYKDPIQAVIREYCTNAADVHIKLGITEPFQVTLPTILDPHFKVRDFGTALSDKEIAGIYTSYGESDKRTDEEQTGMLGLGCKSGFAYGDSFLVNSFRGGMLTTWNAYIDPSKVGKMAQMAVTPTTEPDGIEIVIPVKGEDVNTFRTKALDRVLPYFAITPAIKHADQTELARVSKVREAKGIFEGKGWKYIGNRNYSHQSFAIMGNVAYPLDADVFTDSEMNESMKTLIRGGLVVNFDNGDLEFAISRETLQYTPHTKKHVVTRLGQIADELTAQCDAQFKGCKTLWEAKLMWKEVFRMDGSLYSVRHLFDRRLKFNGKPINESGFSTDVYYHKDVECIMWERSYRRNQIGGYRTQKIEAESRVLVIENDTDIINGIKNRLVALLEPAPTPATALANIAPFTKVYVLKFKTPAAKLAWTTETGFDFPMKSLSTYAKHPLSKYYGSTSGAYSGFNSQKHTSQEFVFDANPNSTGRRHRSVNSDYWQVSDVDMDNDECVYVELDKFEYKDKLGYAKSPMNLLDVIQTLKTIGVPVPTIYGFKKVSAHKAANNPNMTSLWVWIADALKEYLKNNRDVEQALVNREYCLNVINSTHRGLVRLASIVSKWNSVPANGDLIKMFHAINVLAKYDEGKLSVLKSALVNYLNGYKSKLTPSHDVIPDYQKLNAKYPLLFKVSEVVGSESMTDKTWAEPLKNYISMVDLVTP